MSRTIEKGQIGVEITNTASFPISCILHSAETEVEGEPPPRSNFPKKAVIVHPNGGTVRLVDDPIELDIPCQRLVGKMDILIKYGLPNKEEFEAHMKGGVQVVMEHFGFVSAIITDWNPK